MLLAAAIEGLRSADVAVALAPAEREPGTSCCRSSWVWSIRREPSQSPNRRFARAHRGLLRTRRGGDAMSDDKPRNQSLPGCNTWPWRNSPGKTVHQRGLVVGLGATGGADTSHSFRAQLRLWVKTSELQAGQRQQQRAGLARGGAAAFGDAQRSRRAEAGDGGAKDRQSPLRRDQAIGASVELGD